MNEGLWIPVVLFIVTGFCTIGFFYFNHKNRSAIMETVQKSMDTVIWPPAMWWSSAVAPEA